MRPLLPFPSSSESKKEQRNDQKTQPHTRRFADRQHSRSCGHLCIHHASPLRGDSSAGEVTSPRSQAKTEPTTPGINLVLWQSAA